MWEKKENNNGNMWRQWYIIMKKYDNGKVMKKKTMTWK